MEEIKIDSVVMICYMVVKLAEGFLVVKHGTGSLVFDSYDRLVVRRLHVMPKETAKNRHLILGAFLGGILYCSA